MNRTRWIQILILLLIIPRAGFALMVEMSDFELKSVRGHHGIDLDRAFMNPSDMSNIIGIDLDRAFMNASGMSDIIGTGDNHLLDVAFVETSDAPVQESGFEEDFFAVESWLQGVTASVELDVGIDMLLEDVFTAMTGVDINLMQGFTRQTRNSTTRIDMPVPPIVTVRFGGLL